MKDVEVEGPWCIKALEIQDMNDSRSECHVGLKRNEYDDTLFEILPQLLITPSLPSDLGDGDVGSVVSSLAPTHVCASAVGGDTVGIVLDSTLLILEKTVELEFKKTVMFTAPIDFILWRRSILLVGLSSSEIVLVDPRTFEIKEKRKLSQNLSASCQRFFVDAALHSNPDPTKVDVSVVGITGSVYMFNNISLSDGVLDSTHDQNVSVDVDVGSIKGSVKKCMESRNVICSASASKNIMVMGESDGTLSFHNTAEGDETCELSEAKSANLRTCLGFASNVTLKKIIPFEGLLFVLFSNGHLEIFMDFFPTSHLILHDLSHIVHDFSLVMTGESETKLWVIYGDMVGKNYIGIFGGPSFLKEEFSAKIPTTKNLQDCHEEAKFMFPTKVTPFEEPFAFLELSSLGTKVYHMSETSTDATIQKLLSRGKFDDAVALASEYNKDLDVVFKAKARAKMNDLLGVEKSKQFAERSGKLEITFAEMIDALEKIEDGQFVCAFCIQRGLLNLKWVKQLLSVGKGKVKHCMGTEGAKALLLRLKMFFTFEQVFPEPTIQDWVQFESDENTMFLQCVWFLKQEEFEKSERVWRRHYDEFIPNISLSDFGLFFVILFGKNLASQDAVSLFRCILPYAVVKCSEIDPLVENDTASLTGYQMARVSTLIDIVKRQLCSNEREVIWPKEAIDFSKIVIDAVKGEEENLKNSRNQHESTVIRQSMICKEIIKRMTALLQNLIELNNLKQNHSIRIPFLQYTEANVVEVVNSMLFELFHKEEIGKFVNNFLVPFAARKGLEVDFLFYEHVKSVLSELTCHLNSFDIPHEVRVVCLIDFIKSSSIKMECVHAVAEEWPVPWSNGIDSIAVSALRLNVHGDSVSKELQRKIETMRIQVPYRCLLIKYRMAHYNLQTSSGVTMALLRMIKTGKTDEYFEDCQEFIKHTGRADNEKIRFLEYSVQLMDREIPAIIESPEMNTRLLKRLLVRTLQEFRDDELDRFTDEESDRLKRISKTLANVLDDKKILEFLKLQEFVHGLTNSDIVYEEQYPFCVLKNILAEPSGEKSSAAIVQDCKKLSNATATPLCDILVTAAAFYTRSTNTVQDQEKIWEIIEMVINGSGKSFGRSNDPIKRDLVQGAAVTVAQFLFFQSPKCSEHQLQVLHDFLNIITSFDGNNNIQDITKMLHGFRIFCNLREQEIPLEQEFIYIYGWIFFSPGSTDQFFQWISHYGATTLKFGDKDLFKQSFGFIVKEFLSRSLMSASDTEKMYFTKLVNRISSIEGELLATYDKLSEPEQNRNVVKLVEDLRKHAGMCMTPYALRQRNKSRLLVKLLAGNNYTLAAQVALVFEFYTDEEAWSNILNGFMVAGDIKELRKVLTDLRNVSELWMLPEFAEGWKKVSESDVRFLDLCPIPLD